MHSTLTKPLDWLAIQMARPTVVSGRARDNHIAEAERLVHSADFFCDHISAPRDFRFVGERKICFTSPISTPWAQNDIVAGRIYRCAENWQQNPTVILLHGWNAETAYQVLFPYLARRLVRAGVNAAMIELPFHGQRRPRGNGAVTNFLADDLLHVAQATQQAIADTRALGAWLAEQGCEHVGLWGISLGAWLGGLVACADARMKFLALLTPVSRMDRVIRDLDFCEPIRRSINGAVVRLDPLNLHTHRPKMARENILIVESQHDLFAPVETIEELWQAWGEPEIWRTRHGHISVLMSVPVLERQVAWIAGRML